MSAKLHVISNAITDIALQDTSLDIWDSKYRLKTKDGAAIDATIDDTYKRVAKALAEVETDKEKQEKYYKEFLWALRQGAIPAGRIVSNAGALAHKPATSTINCTVSGDIVDSMDDILAKVHEAGLTLRAGCGIGYCFSTLRPKGAFVSGAGAYTSGPLSFMDIYDKMCFTVSSAGGRRGAQMATFDIGHPDVIDFIRAKREDGRLRQFNLSLLITAEFMEAVTQDLPWHLSFPVTEKELKRDNLNLHDNKLISWRDLPAQEGYIINADGLVACRIHKTMPAKRLWDIIMSSTYDYAEPGFILIDRVNDMNNNWWCEKITATNPCVAQGTLIETPEGLKAVETLKEGDTICTVSGQGHIKTIEIHENMPVKRVCFDNGKQLCVTDGHIFHIIKDNELNIETRFSELKVGDKVRVFNWQNPSTDIITTTIISIEPAGITTVYDLYEPISDTWITESIVNRGCGEQALPPYGSCWTGSMRLNTNYGLIKTDDAYQLVQQGKPLLIGVDDIFSKNKTDLRPCTLVTNGHKEVFELRFSNGQRIELTADHRVYTPEGWREVQQLTPNSEVYLQTRELSELNLIDPFYLGALAYFFNQYQGDEIIITKQNRRAFLRPLLDQLCINYAERQKGLFISRQHPVVREIEQLDLNTASKTVLEGYIYSALAVATYYQNKLTVYGSKAQLTHLAHITEQLSNETHQPIHHGEECYRLTLPNLILHAPVIETKQLNLQYALYGWLLADGWRTDSMGLVFNDQDDGAMRDLVPQFQALTGTDGHKPKAYIGQQRDMYSIACYKKDVIQDLRKHLGLSDYTSKQLRVPELIFKADSQAQASFLSAVFCADGSINQDKLSIRLTSASRLWLEDIQLLLLNFGIHGTINSGIFKGNIFYNLHLLQRDSYRFYRYIGFHFSSHKQIKLQGLLCEKERWHDMGDTYTSQLIEIRNKGIQPVYDIEEFSTNTLVVNGIVVHNCLLGSINLTRFVEKPFSHDAYFDWSAYRKTIRIFTRLLDNVVEVNGLPLAKQRQEIIDKRRHGMGYLGLGSTLTMLGMKYGDDNSLQFTEEVTKTLAVEGWKVALTLAQEKGPAPIMEREFIITGEMLHKRPEMIIDGYNVGDKIKGKVLHGKYSRYMQQIAQLEPELVAQLTEIGARFSHHSSIAPTGTISLSLANNASNGIEPSFAHHYARNVIREGKKSKEKVDVFSFELLAYRHIINSQAMPYSDNPAQQLPDYFIAADDVTPKQHVDIQAAAQKWIDSSISKTANVPTDYPYEDFKDIYRYAYEKGLKGCTTFRFNPEVFQGVLVKESDLENTIYQFTLEDGEVIEVKGNQDIEYDGELHSAANLFDALKEGYYGKF